MTTIITRDRVRNSQEIVTCAFAREGLCEGPLASGGQCRDCARYNELLRRAVELYGDVRWALTPDGQLYDI